jgi:CRISPR-associated RAMP protein (TIGR02581 family)
MRKKMLCDARFQLEIEIKGPTLIKSGEGGLSGPDMAFVRTYAYGDQEPQAYLPGTSLKGIFRSHIERLARTLAKTETPVCLPYQLVGDGPELSCGKRLDKLPKPEAYKKQCLACQMFGSLQFKGRTFIADAYATDVKQLRYEIRDGVAIDRKTGGAAAKYDLEVLTRGTFRTSVVLDNFESWQIGALGLVLQDLKDERLRLGMGTSRGLGHVQGKITTAELRYPMKHDGSFCGIASLASSEERKSYGLAGGKSDADLPEPEHTGIWKNYRVETNGIQKLFDAARDEFFAFLESYRWNGGSP